LKKVCSKVAAVRYNQLWDLVSTVWWSGNYKKYIEYNEI